MEVRTALTRAVRSQWHSSAIRTSRTLRRAQTPTWRTSMPCTASPMIRSHNLTTSAVRWQDQPRDHKAIEEHLDSALDLRTDSVASTRQTPSHFASPRAQEERRAERGERGEGRAPRFGNSVIDMMVAWEDAARIPPSVSGYRPGDKTNMGNLLSPSPNSSIRDMLDASGNTYIQPQPLLPLPLPVRLGPNLGRTIRVSAQRNVDAAKAFRMLDVLCRRNRVSYDARKQLFHERPGLKKKRIKSERWRKTFKEGFKGMVALVKKMKKQGW